MILTGLKLLTDIFSNSAVGVERIVTFSFNTTSVVEHQTIWTKGWGGYSINTFVIQVTLFWIGEETIWFSILSTVKC